jgi:two-component system OmpR family response regulator
MQKDVTDDTKDIRVLRAGRTMQLLLIESDMASSGWLADRLRDSGFRPRLVGSPSEAVAQAGEAQAVVIDLPADCANGTRLVEPMRDAGIIKPVLVVSTQGDWRDRVETLDAGADAYILKPFRSEEIAARLRALIRRDSGSHRSRIAHGPFACDLASLTIQRDGVALDLTGNEFRMLRIFLLRAGQVVSPRELRDLLYTGIQDRTKNAIEVHVARLRRKIGRQFLTTVRGLGYCFDIHTGSQSLDVDIGY